MSSEEGFSFLFKQDTTDAVFAFSQHAVNRNHTVDT